MKFVLSCTVLASLAMCLSGCGGGLKKFPVAQTSGIVLCEGQPVAGAMVFFEPLQSGIEANVGKQGFAFSGDDGRFVISTYGTNDGAVIGQHRVRVGGDPKLCNCVMDSEIDVMQVEIKEGESNEFELVLKPRTGNERIPIGYDDDDED